MMGLGKSTTEEVKNLAGGHWTTDHQTLQIDELSELRCRRDLMAWGNLFVGWSNEFVF